MLALIVFICALDSLNPLLGQNAATLKGRVTYARSGEPAICYVTVLSLSSNAVIAYGSTDPEGNYSVAFSSVADSVALSLSGLTVKTLRQIIPNSDGTYDFKVEESQLMLDEVKIKAAKISQSEDTVSYNVESFRSKEDRVIEDVLKKTSRDYNRELRTAALQAEAHRRADNRRDGPSKGPIRTGN